MAGITIGVVSWSSHANLAPTNTICPYRSIATVIFPHHMFKLSLENTIIGYI